jgi:hypothetical protein
MCSSKSSSRSSSVWHWRQLAAPAPSVRVRQVAVSCRWGRLLQVVQLIYIQLLLLLLLLSAFLRA